MFFRRQKNSQSGQRLLSDQIHMPHTDMADVLRRTDFNPYEAPPHFMTPGDARRVNTVAFDETNVFDTKGLVNKADLVPKHLEASDPLSAIVGDDGRIIGQSGATHDLQTVQDWFPSLVVQPLPKLTKYAYCANVGADYTINLPDQIVVVKLIGTSPFWYSFFGNAYIPAAVMGDNDQPSYFSGISGETPWIYIGGNNVIHVASPTANNIVSAYGFNREFGQV